MAEFITISHAGSSRPWAAWIAHQLEQQGIGTSMLRWDPELETSLVDALTGLLEAPGRILLVLDDWYFGLGPRPAEEWTEALRTVVAAHSDRFVAVNIANGALPAATAALAPVSLLGLSAREAGRRLMRRVGIDRSRAAEEADGGPRFPNDDQAQWNVPPRNERFTGRDEVLEQIHRVFLDSEGERCVLRGISGVGKTQIGREYAYRFRNEYDIVWQVNSGYPGTAREQLAELALRLELPAGRETGDRIRAVQNALRSGNPYRNWLLIFDGADSVDGIENLLPDGPGHVLITTLTRDWSAFSRTQEIEIHPFTRRESVAFACRRAPRLTAAQADSLAAAVQDLPLLVNQTASWLAINETMPVEPYIDSILNGRPNEFGLSFVDDDYQKSVWTSWSLTQNMLREKHPDASELLKIFGFFSPDAIPVGLIQSARPGDLPPHLESLAADPIGWHTNLRRLNEATAVMRMEYPAADTRVDQGVESVQMHHLYHSYLRTGMPASEREQAAAAACRVLVSASPRNPNDTRLWERYAQIIPHLDHSGVFDSADPNVQGLVLECIDYLKVRGEYSAGLQLVQKALPRWQARLGPTDRNLLLLDYYHAIMLRRVGRYREAEAAGRSSVALLQEHAADSNELLRSKQGLGGSLWALASYEEARDLFEEVLAAYQVLLGEEHPRTLDSRHNLAAVLAQLGHYQDSLDIELNVLQVKERVLKDRHPSTLQSGTDCAGLLRWLGRYDEALTRQKQNVNLHYQVMDAHHPQVLRAEHNLALCLRRSGQYQQAEALMRTLLARSEQVHGPDHPDTLAVLADFATLQRSHGAPELARELAERAAVGHERLLGDVHPFAAGVLGNHALVLAEFGERDESLHMAERALSRMRSAVGDRHPWTVGCSVNTSGARALAGDVEGAAELSLAAAETAEEILSGRHPLTLSAWAAHATDLRLLRRGKEAGEKEQEVIRILAETLGDQHPHTLGVRRRQRPYWDFEPQPV
ncbi:tetratricopeptide repeat protein [Streptomyces sp. SID5785]|uniref:FxSxx-COOH system tetratricopeptide repeat protein n=1 Tax=Streptomyces sp. SID5785 TaxID=2690309 RepID=UPI001361D62C|nr:FxSxx-COOH system tetratricopeptide repeat protein [Streptomyces sp. SID5785]MZD03473.1 tetratricopeptide repeat protein [Streptomyces sp. SID5785]